MSRRKQSNPKPLKREDEEEWSNGDVAMETETQSPNRPTSTSSNGSSQHSNTTDKPSESPPPPPRLRLNTSLATDPALMPSAASPMKPDPSPEPPPPTPPSRRDFSLLSSLPPALTSAIAAGLFTSPGRPEPPQIFMCAPCGIRFSSPSTLEAHRTYYCSHRPGNQTNTDQDERTSTDDLQTDETAEPAAKVMRTGKQYTCSHCSYSADKKVSLNRHMRMHAPSPGAPSTPVVIHTNGDSELDPNLQAMARDRYCAECDIKFSSIKTFQAHKTHYCRTRQVVKQAPQPPRGSSCTSGSAPTSPNESRKSPCSPTELQRSFLALPTNPILIVPYTLIREARVWPGSTIAGLPHQDTPFFLLPNGSLQPMTPSLVSSNLENKSESEVLKSANRPRETQTARDPSTPLDLTTRRSPSSVASRPESEDNEKENRLRCSQTPEQIVCAPSLPTSPATSDRSPRHLSSPSAEGSPRRRHRESGGTTPLSSSAEHCSDGKNSPHDLPIRINSDGVVGQPSVLVKQGVSKCKECNIVFCKYENYLAHKKHYCAKRDEEPVEPNSAPASGQYQQLICVACGIKFSSMDNLATHQTFYCTKTTSESRSRSASNASDGVSGWRCPCCDTISPTAAAAQRHMETHSDVKGFRCIICKYKGNTLRGMRTHIRMHLPKSKAVDFQEENYIECIGQEDDASSPGSGSGSERVHKCGSCAYTSTYRGNVVRHARLVHDITVPPASPTPPLAPPTPYPPPTPSPAFEIKTEPEDAPIENYCKTCDISFKYHNVFKAHKQFYCKQNNQAGVDNGSPNNNVPRATETPAL